VAEDEPVHAYLGKRWSKLPGPEHCYVAPQFSPMTFTNRQLNEEMISLCYWENVFAFHSEDLKSVPIDSWLKQQESPIAKRGTRHVIMELPALANVRRYQLRYNDFNIVFQKGSGLLCNCRTRGTQAEELHLLRSSGSGGLILHARRIQQRQVQPSHPYMLRDLQATVCRRSCPQDTANMSRMFGQALG